jgi:dolichol-phosphate mannosyltransferase
MSLYSVVVPVMNEEGNIGLMYDRVKNTFDKMNENFEIIFVDDGSKDNSFLKMRELCETDSRVKAVKLSRNFGHQIGVTAGIDHSQGEAVIMIDGDLQDPPEFIEELVNKYKEGYNVVYAVREKRKGETFFKRATAALFYRILRRLTKIDIPLNTGDFRLIDRKVADSLVLSREKHRFLRGLTSWAGFKQIGIPFTRQERFSGSTKYPMKKMIKFALDGITSFSFFPIKFFMFIGFIVGFLSLVFGGYIIIKRILGGTIEPWASLMVAILFLSGIQLFSIGIIGDYLGRVYDEVRDRPLYIVDYIVNFDKEGKPAAKTTDREAKEIALDNKDL